MSAKLERMSYAKRINRSLRGRWCIITWRSIDGLRCHSFRSKQEARRHRRQAAKSGWYDWTAVRRFSRRWKQLAVQQRLDIEDLPW